MQDERGAPLLVPPEREKKTKDNVRLVNNRGTGNLADFNGENKGVTIYVELHLPVYIFCFLITE